MSVLGKPTRLGKTTLVSPPYDMSMISLLFTVKKNQIKMLHDRGFDVSNEQGIFNLTVEQFRDFYTEYWKANHYDSFTLSLGGPYTKNDKGLEPIYVYYLYTLKDTNSVSNKQILKAIDDVRRAGFTHIIFISEQPLSHESAEIVRKKNELRCEHFVYQDLSHNKPEYFLTPKHIVLSKSEKEKLLSGPIKMEELPEMCYDDPMARYYGMSVGDVVKIERRNLVVDTLVENTISYRRVTNRSLFKK